MIDGESSKAHWDEVYESKGPENVSWFQPSLEKSLAIFDRIGLPPTAGVIDVGGGASTLVDDLLARGFSDLAILDISQKALETSRRRLDKEAGRVHWIEADITSTDLASARYDLWHDRAVFHFLTSAESRRRYVELARRALKPGGHIIVATFGTGGPLQCSGLDVVRYDADRLHEEFGSSFQPIEHLKEVHRTPWGTEQEFLYCYCRRAG
jgi:SAM-dependent methyltransferase